MTLRFDQSLPRLVGVVGEIFGRDLLADAAIVREAAGRLSVILPTIVKPEALATAEAKLRVALGAYARPDRVIGDAESAGAERLLREAQEVFPVTVDGLKIRLLDRRVVGADWLRPPALSATGIPRIVFASLKGGVGRSTALCVLAAHLSRRGRRVLAIDFDLEAPGIGTMLLHDRELPRFGTLDYLVENGLSGIDDTFIADLEGGSILGSEGARVTVVPAIGRTTIDNPGDMLSKIARAYLEDFRADGSTATLSQQLQEMVERFETTGAYDAVLVDVRAGLHETTAAAMLALGGEVLLFGIDQPQTFVGYRLLMAHFARFTINAEDDWRERFRFVHAKASESSSKRAAADERFKALYNIVAPPPPAVPNIVEPLTEDDFEMVWDDDAEATVELQAFEAPAIVHISDDARYGDFDPVANIDLLSSQTYSSTFRELLEYADTIVDTGGPQEP
jgi:MinD-like ATPase involved in chromosome partitioning or flagellar assembly